MIFGISFGKTKTSQQSSTDTNIKENPNQSQSQSTTGQTSTNTRKSGTTNKSTTGTQSSDMVDRQNKTPHGTIGSASCRERVYHYVKNSMIHEYYKKKKPLQTYQ